MLAATLEAQNVADGVTGSYYWDEQAGTVHGYATIAYQVIYNLLDAGKAYIVVPIHEPENFQRVTNPTQRNCAGVFRGGQKDDVVCIANSQPEKPGNALWSGAEMTPGIGDAWTKGYFLIAELEQIWVGLLSQTLCYSYPGDSDRNNVNDTADQLFSPKVTPENPGGLLSCRALGKWDATKPLTGMPRGDWCSETNGPADDNCHDAYLTIAYHAFAGANIKEGTCDPL